MTFPVAGSVGDVGGPIGYTYAAVVIGVGASGGQVRGALREIRFTGWLAPPEDGWQVAIPVNPRGTVASGRRGVVGLGEWLAHRLHTTVLAFRVLADRQLLIAGWVDGRELGRYVSDPSRDHPDSGDILDEPLGVEIAPAIADACGRADAADELTELLSEELDTDSTIESERFIEILRLLGLPRWLVSVSSLPRDIPAGPRSRELIRLGAGRDGLLGVLHRRAGEVVRRHRPPPLAVPDPPRQHPDIDPWLL
ncbi:MAG TPA: hypothetical protein VH395_11665 [Jatrophihabitantaceae bacterium]